MINNPAMEEIIAGNYVENYFDMCENMPDEVQREITCMRELDVAYQALLNKMDKIHQQLNSTSASEVSAVRRLLVELQDNLIMSQEVADSKLRSVQNIQDLIENKQRVLDADCRKLELETENERSENSSRDRENSERASKRPRRTPRTENGQSLGAIAATIASAISNNVHTASSSPSAAPGGTGTGSALDRMQGQDSPHGSAQEKGSAKTTSNKALNQKKANKKKKRKARVEREREDSPTEIPIDPDEPTYCLCEQVSYGEMIGCDNDLCPIEWFHFSCVSLTHKPKGKWFCPKCRGDKPTVMKPRAQFLRELEKYNKEKEEKS